MLLVLVLLTFSSNSMAEWVEYSTRQNGDIYFFDNARVEKNDNQISVWTRILYKTSVMGASSYQSFMKIDCSEKSEITSQTTFYSDTDWTTAAMATNPKEKPKKLIKADSATEQLAAILCKA